MTQHIQYRGAVYRLADTLQDAVDAYHWIDDHLTELWDWMDCEYDVERWPDFLATHFDTDQYAERLKL